MKLLLLFIAACHAWYNPWCSFKRTDALACFKQYVDLNHDGAITEDELDKLRAKYETKGSFMSWIDMLISRWNIDTSNHVIMRDCDYDHDGRLTPKDFMDSAKTCMPSHWAMCLVKVLCDEEEKDAKKAAYKVYKKKV